MQYKMDIKREDNKLPITSFSSEEEFQKCCRYYQHLLFLDDWFIKYKMVDSIETEYDGTVDGQCSFDYNNKSATIEIVNKSTFYDETNTKLNVECVIIHELLHLKVEYWNNSNIFDKSCSLESTLNHQYMEQMAKSILMARYNLDYNYFLEEYDEEEKEDSKTGV